MCYFPTKIYHFSVNSRRSKLLWIIRMQTPANYAKKSRVIFQSINALHTRQKVMHNAMLLVFKTENGNWILNFHKTWCSTLLHDQWYQWAQITSHIHPFTTRQCGGTKEIWWWSGSWKESCTISYKNPYQWLLLPWEVLHENRLSWAKRQKWILAFALL